MPPPQLSRRGSHVAALAGVLMDKLDWANTPATKTVAETIDRRADFIVTSARKDEQGRV